MARDWRIAVLWLGVIIFAAWILWWAWSGYPLDGPVCFDETAKDNCPHYNVIAYSAWRLAELAGHWAALITALFTAVLAVFAARLWRSTDRLWNASNEMQKHAERTSKKELRAYLGVEPLGISEYAGHNVLIGHFHIRNTGKIPARNVSIFSTIQLDPDGARKTFPIGTPGISPTVLQPGATMEFTSADAWPIPADQLDGNEPLKMKGYLYVWGEVLYTDEFNTVGWSTFCHRYPCDMFGMAERELTNGRVHNRSIDRKFARYHEGAGNDAG